MFSGGIGSWAAAKRVAQRHGPENMTLLFTDTLMEDEDLYRFIQEAADNVGAPLVRIAEGRDPWQIFFDKRFLGNSRIDPCSKYLKREIADKWIAANFKPEDVTVYVGIDWTEEHRFTRMRDRKLPWVYEAPMCEAPYVTKDQMLEDLRSQGIAIPRLYRMNFAHNNCGGFCIKAGKAHYENLLRQMPERYRYHEEKEQEIRRFLGKDVAILVDTKTVKLPEPVRWFGEDGVERVKTKEIVKTPLTLRDFRLRLAADPKNFDQFDFGGCGCFLTEPEDYEEVK